MDAIVVFVTASGVPEAERIAGHLLARRLIACANIVPGVTSHYVWKGAVERAEECLVVMKTLRRLFPWVRDEVRAVHSYEVPEIIALPIVEGDGAYLAWIEESVGAPPSSVG